MLKRQTALHIEGHPIHVGCFCSSDHLRRRYAAASALSNRIVDNIKPEGSSQTDAHKVELVGRHRAASPQAKSMVLLP